MAPRASSRLARGTHPLTWGSASLEVALDPRHHTYSPDRSIKCSDAWRAPGSKANPRHAGPLTPPGNQISTLFNRPTLCSHLRHCAGAMREDRCHSVTLCRPLSYLLHVALLRGRRHPRKGYDHQLHSRPGWCRDVRPTERVFSVTSGPVRPSSPLYHHPGHRRVIPSTAGIEVDGTPPRLPLCSFRSPVSQTLELVYGWRSNKDSSATTLEAIPGKAQEPPRRMPGVRFTRTDIESSALYAMPPHRT
jgi:hypothetical protein